MRIDSNQHIRDALRVDVREAMWRVRRNDDHVSRPDALTRPTVNRDALGCRPHEFRDAWIVPPYLGCTFEGPAGHQCAATTHDLIHLRDLMVLKGVGYRFSVYQCPAYGKYSDVVFTAHWNDSQGGIPNAGLGI